MIRNFYELDAWKGARGLTREIYTCTKSLPKDELYGLSSQMRRATVSIMANIAEGFGRQSLKEKINFYNQAHGSLTELQSHIVVCSDLKYAPDKELKVLFAETHRVQSIIRGLIRSTKRKL